MTVTQTSCSLVKRATSVAQQTNLLHVEMLVNRSERCVRDWMNAPVLLGCLSLVTQLAKQRVLCHHTTLAVIF
jgi:hypothetical protein